MKSKAMSRRFFLQGACATAAALAVAGPPMFRPAHAAPGERKVETHYTSCDNCNGVPFCGIKFETTDGVITSMDSWGQGYPAGPICSKGFATLQRQYHPDRLLYPMVRTTPKGSPDPRWQRITWTEAYRRIAHELNEAKRKYGPEKVIFYCGDPKEPRAAVRRLASVYGSINFGTESSVNCSSAQMMANVVTFGSMRLNTGAPAPGTKCCLIWGTNFAYSNAPTLKKALKVKREDGCKYIVIDPRATPTAAVLADIHLRPRTAVTAALAAGMANVIISENLHDAEFCEKWIEGWQEYKDYVSGFTPEKTEEITGVPKADMIEAARTFATNKPSVILNSTQSTIHDRNAINNHRGMVMLYAITGQAGPFKGKKPPSPFPPGFVFWPFTDDKFTRYELVKDKFHQRLDLPYYPAWAEYTSHIMLANFPEYVRDGGCKVFLAWGFNVMIWSQTPEYVKALEALDFSMATDYFYRPHSHDHMDMILPAATNFERYAPFMVFGRKCYGRTPITPLGQAREDWRIAMEIGDALGYGNECFGGDPVKACDDILGWWDLSYAKLQQDIAKGVQATTPYPELASSELGYPTKSGKIEAVASRLTKHGYPGLPEYKEPYQPTAEYPLLIISGTRRAHITHSKTRKDTPWLYELESRPYCDINPEDAAARNLKHGDPVVLSSQWGKINAYANVTNLLPKGMVGMMHGWVEANVNLLMPREYDPISGYPSLKEIAVQVSKA